MPNPKGTHSQLRRSALMVGAAGILLLATWAVFAGPVTAVPGNCPVGPEWTQVNGSSGSQTVNGVTISWSGDTVTVSGGTATICVKAGNNNSGVLTNFSGTYTLTCAVFGCNPQGQLPAISHVQWTTTTPTTSTSTTSTSTTSTSSTTTTTETTTTSGTTTTSTTTPGGTTTTPTTTSPTVSPTTVTPSESTTPPEVAPTTVSPGGTAFTGIENAVPIGAVALVLMTAGSGLLWASHRFGKKGED